MCSIFVRGYISSSDELVGVPFAFEENFAVLVEENAFAVDVVLVEIGENLVPVWEEETAFAVFFIVLELALVAHPTSLDRADVFVVFTVALALVVVYVLV